MDVIAMTLMPIGMLGFIFGLIAFSKVIRLETELDHLRLQLHEALGSKMEQSDK